MTNQRSAFQHAGAILSWPVGMALATWRYVWRTTPVYRSEESVDDAADPPPFSEHLSDERLRRPADGVGPQVNRRYRTEICASELNAEELIRRVAGNPNRMAPREVAFFVKTRGEAGELRVGDEFLILMPGPWNGPVRVVDRTPTSFRFATLQGHLEAGQIEFRAIPTKGHVIFEIESWASSGDRLSAFMYDRLRLSKEVQLNLWTHFLERVVRTSRGRMTGGIQVTTYRGSTV